MADFVQDLLELIFYLLYGLVRYLLFLGILTIAGWIGSLIGLVIVSFIISFILSLTCRIWSYAAMC